LDVWTFDLVGPEGAHRQDRKRLGQPKKDRRTTPLHANRAASNYGNRNVEATRVEMGADTDSDSRTGDSIATFPAGTELPAGFRPIGRVEATIDGAPAVTVDGSAYEGVAGHTHF
jgi:hypothetical protein